MAIINNKIIFSFFKRILGLSEITLNLTKFFLNLCGGMFLLFGVLSLFIAENGVKIILQSFFFFAISFLIEITLFFLKKKF
ncbi:hypothetical protein ACFGXE_10660 [Pasteurella multocida]